MSRSSSPSPGRHPEDADVIICAGGPLLLRGDHVIEDADGNTHRTTRPVTALCRCGLSARRPWCDGTHQLLPEDKRPR